MTRIISAFTMLAVLAGGLAYLCAADPAKPKDKDAKPPQEKTDILKEVQQWNSDAFLAPPTEFRKGNVTPRKLDEKALTKIEHGFQVSLPSNAPIPTLTIYQGKIYASGGFHSKEFYCLKADTGELVWGVNLDDDGPSAAVCEDDVVVFNTESCTIFALDAKTGKQLWSYWLGDPLTSTPTIANGKVFTSYPASGRGQVQQMNQAPNAGNQPNGKDQPKQRDKEKAKAAPPCSHVLAAFDLKTGKILWQRWLESDVMSAPIAVDKELYATSFAGVVYKFNQDDGKVLSAVRSRATSAPVVVGKEIHVTRRADDGKGEAKEMIVSAARADITAITKTPSVAGTPTTPIVGAGPKPAKPTTPTVATAPKAAPYITPSVQLQSKFSEQGKKLDASNGFAGGAPASANASAASANIGQASVSTMQAFQGSRILNAEGRNFNCMGDEVVCTDPATGKNLWSHKLEGDLKKEGGFLAAPPATAGGMLFLVTLKGDVLQMDPKTGKIAKTYKVGHEVRSQAVVDAGRIYVGTQNGKVICINTGDPKFTGWSCWGGNSAHTGVANVKK